MAAVARYRADPGKPHKATRDKRSPPAGEAVARVRPKTVHSSARSRRAANSEPRTAALAREAAAHSHDHHHDLGQRRDGLTVRGERLSVERKTCVVQGISLSQSQARSRTRAQVARR